MLDLAGRAGALPAGVDHVGLDAAVGAEAVPRVPVQHRLGLGERRQMFGRRKALDRDRAQIDDEQIVARLQRFGARRRDAVAEARSAVEQAEEHRLGGGRERARLVRRERRIVHAVALLEHDHLAADDIAPRAACRSGRPQATRRQAAARRRDRSGFGCSRDGVLGRDSDEGTSGGTLKRPEDRSSDAARGRRASNGWTIIPASGRQLARVAAISESRRPESPRIPAASSPLARTQAAPGRPSSPRTANLR